MNQTIYLTKTDTIIGFVSQSATRLTNIKKRSSSKYYIKAISSLAVLKSFVRVPKKYKNRVRRATNTTFIMADNNSYRLIKDKHHSKLINQLQWAYTTSANLSGKDYDEAWAKDVADIVIEPISSNKEVPSKILKLNNSKITKVR